ncbi:MAG: hypothetical protein J0I08_23505 [Rhizobiales bacterium]|nr:hypothetical protein [Hyphomicrobiales bacterium]
MAEELSIEPEAFAVEVEWPSAPEAGGNLLLDASIARFAIKAASTSLTSFLMDTGVKGTHITIPAYHLVEWLTQNWWAFLYEPRKSGREDVYADFRSRHWLGFARNGFALPDVLFAPSGETIEIEARSSYLRFAELSFTETLKSVVATSDVRSQFSNFIAAILDRMSERGVADSEAHRAWSKVISTSADEEPYCRLMGAMGLSPYVEHPEIDGAIDKISGLLTDDELTDLCEAATIGGFSYAAEFSGRIAESLRQSPSIKMNAILGLERPLDNVRHAYEWGYNSASRARQALGIKSDDPSGRKSFFDKLGFDPLASSDLGHPVSNLFPIHGAVAREDETIKLALSTGVDKEFSAARASFLAWSSDDKVSRLVTTARTRQQQASRAFGAELLAPAAFIKKRLGRDREVSSFSLDSISNEIGVASSIVRLQAQNNGYKIWDEAA